MGRVPRARASKWRTGAQKTDRIVPLVRGGLALLLTFCIAAFFQFSGPPRRLVAADADSEELSGAAENLSGARGNFLEGLLWHGRGFGDNEGHGKGGRHGGNGTGGEGMIHGGNGIHLRNGDHGASPVLGGNSGHGGDGIHRGDGGASGGPRGTPVQQRMALEESSGTGHFLQSLRLREAPSKARGTREVYRTTTKGQAAVAVCLGGGIRVLELTAPSMERFLFPAYAPADVFLFSTVDAQSHKVALFSQAHTAALRGTWRIRAITFNVDTPLDDETREAVLLDPIISGRGILLHSFELIEGCMKLVKEAELRRGGLQYQWVIRARPDSFWRAPPPALASLNRSEFATPAGFEWGGVNDRFGIVAREHAEATMERLSRLPLVLRDYKPPNDSFNLGMVNGEQALMWQLKAAGVPPAYVDVSFCLITQHTWPKFFLPLRDKLPPVFSMNTLAPMNGGYCAPCDPVLTGGDAVECLETGAEGKNLAFHRPRTLSGGWSICNSSRKWAPNWGQIFDAQVGPESSRSRRIYEAMTGAQCVERLSFVLSLVEVYRGPSPWVLCRVRQWVTLFEAVKAGVSASINHLVLIMAQHVRNESISVLSDVPVLSAWATEGLRWVPRPQTCAVLFSLIGDRPLLYFKGDVKQRLAEAGVSVLRCGGRITQEVCLGIFPAACGPIL